MSSLPCRDCGTLIDPRSRGCPTCALNFAGERMIDRLLLVGLLLVGVVVVLAAAAFYFS